MDVQGERLWHKMPENMFVLQILSHVQRGGNLNESEICNEERGHGTDCGHPVGDLSDECLSGIEMVASLSHH